MSSIRPSILCQKESIPKAKRWVSEDERGWLCIPANPRLLCLGTKPTAVRRASQSRPKLVLCWPTMTATVIDSALFCDLFSRKAMRDIFSDERRIQHYLDIEAALARVQAELGIIPMEAAEEICRHCFVEQIDMARLKKQIDTIGHPVLPVVQQLVSLCAAGLGEWCHWGTTTQDIIDTATVLQIREALNLVEEDLDGISAALADLAWRHRNTAMAGRTKTQQAVPITFGYKMAVLLAAFQRHQVRLKELRQRVLVGEFGGAVGTLASLGSEGLKVQEALMAASA